MWVTIDGRELEAEAGETILQVAKRSGIAIPSLCHHPGLEPAGACRVCVVEVTAPSATESEISAACVHRVTEGLTVKTRSPRAERVRRAVVDLLLARAPQSDRIQALARRYGLSRSSYPPREEADLCVLCGQCIRVCETVGPAALSTAGRGADARVAVAFHDDASECVACGACAANCPTGAIPVEEQEGTRRIWGHTFHLQQCLECGCYTLPPEHISLLGQLHGLDQSYFELCDACRRRTTVNCFQSVMVK
jgi:NADH dehydrogenase/NADH:ubiquinone oxidoreductase subunit G